MKIQFNSDNNITASEKLAAKFEKTISEALGRFSEQITRVEIHFSDENGQKSGLNDKRCMLETRLEGMQPIAVTNYGDTLEHALKGAIDKTKTSLDTIIGRLRNH